MIVCLACADPRSAVDAPAPPNAAEGPRGVPAAAEHVRPVAGPKPEPEPAPEPAPEPEREPERRRAPDGTTMVACGSVPAKMACIPGGPFVRGASDRDEHARPRETIWMQTFWIDQYEVTYAEYKACEAAGECDRAGPRYVDFDRPLQPVNGINWFHADKYCKAQGKRLPTEAEWEKAARGTDGRLYPWGDDPATCTHAIIKGTRGRGCGVKKKGKKPDTGYPWEVGSRPPNQYGVYDMAGNAYEWVADWFSPSYGRCGADCRGVSPRGPCGGADTCPGHRRKVVRGGSWYWDYSRATTVYRRAHVPDNDPFHHFGFRCASDVGAQVKTSPAGHP